MPLVIVCLLLRKVELLALSDCVELSTKARSSTVNDLYFCFFIVGVLIDLICHLPRIGYEGAGNQSFERRGCLSLFLTPSLSVPLFMSPGFVWCRVKVEEGWNRKRRMTSHNCTQRFLFRALQGENTKREPLLPPAASLVNFPPSHMDLLERIFSYFHTTR